MNISTDLHQHIVKHYLQGQEPEGFDANYGLIGNNVLDSLALMNLVTYIEQTYQIEFGDYDITPENFETIADIVSFIEQKRQE